MFDVPFFTILHKITILPIYDCVCVHVCVRAYSLVVAMVTGLAPTALKNCVFKGATYDDWQREAMSLYRK